MMNIKYIPIHIGLLGHIDAGKTAIAKCLSDIVSTAGLDKHSQSQKRGITIDLGFTFFPLDQYMITLVDAPGHADLIKSVVSCANIIDMALLVIDAKEGPQVQTGEHLVILEIFNIPKIIVLINKIDMVTKTELENTKNKINSILNNTKFAKKYEILEVSAKEKLGFGKVKEIIKDEIGSLKIQRNCDNPFKFLFDHYFFKKGFGTVMTGTVLEGHAKISDEIIILPPNIKTKIKSIQKWKTSSTECRAGDRCGIAVSGVEPSVLFRGCFATTTPETFQKTDSVIVDVKESQHFMKQCHFGQHITINHGMMSLNARIFPFYEKEKLNQIFRIAYSPEIEERKYKAIIFFEKAEYIKKKELLLLSRLDLSPKSLRIMGSAEIVDEPSNPIYLHKERIKHGVIKRANYSVDSIIVEGLANSKEGATTLLNKQTEFPVGTIVSTFGLKGNVEIKYPYKEEIIEKLSEGNFVSVILYKEILIDFSKSYEKLIPK